MTNKLSWTLNTDASVSAWVATGVGGIKYNVILGKEGIEGIVILPSGQVFIAAFEETATTPVDDMKQYLQAMQSAFSNVRDTTLAYVQQQVRDLAEKDVRQNQSRIILPGQQS